MHHFTSWVYFYLFRGIYTKKVSISGDLLSRSKRSIYYTDTELDVKTGENSTYQELDRSPILSIVNVTTTCYKLKCICISFLNDATLPKICLWRLFMSQKTIVMCLHVSMIEKITMHLWLYPTLNFQNGFFFYIYNLSSQIDY